MTCQEKNCTLLLANFSKKDSILQVSKYYGFKISSVVKIVNNCSSLGRVANCLFCLSENFNLVECCSFSSVALAHEAMHYWLILVKIMTE